MEYCSKVTLEVNGKTITDFKSFTEKEVQYYKQVSLMNKTGHMAVTPRHAVSVEYVKPTSGEFDWASVKSGRLSVEYENGQRVTYTGVYILTKGEEKTDGDNEITRTIDLGAEGRFEE